LVRVAAAIAVACGVLLEAKGLPAVRAPQLARPRTTTLESPGGHIAFALQVDAAGAMQYRITRDGIPALDWSRAGIVIDGVNLSDDVLVSDIVSRSSTSQDYPTRGVHAIAHDRSNNLTLGLEHAKTHTKDSLAARAFEAAASSPDWCPGSDPGPVPAAQDRGLTPDCAFAVASGDRAVSAYMGRNPGNL
jgi:hypothetical protein